MEQRMGRLRRLAPLFSLGVAASVVLAAARISASGDPWWVFAVAFVLAVGAVRAFVRTVDSNGAIVKHDCAELFFAAAIISGIDVFVAGMMVVVAHLGVEVVTPTRRRAQSSDWMQRTRLAVTSMAASSGAFVAWGTVEAIRLLVPDAGVGTQLVTGVAAPVLAGVWSAFVLMAVIEWVSTGKRKLIPDSPRRVIVAPTANASAGAVLAVLLMEVHPVAPLLALLAAAPLPNLIRRRMRLEEEHQQVLRLMSLATDTDGKDGEDVVEAIGETIAALLHYREAEVRNHAPAGVKELGTELHDGSWLVLSDPLTAEVVDEDDQPRLDGLGALAGPLIESAKRRARLTEQVQTDGLTGLANRTGLEQAIERMEADDPVVAVFLDLNGFKPINDTYGHDAGDLILIEIGSRLNEQLRGSDVAARVGGDEFVLALPGITDGKVARDVTGRIAARIAEPMTLEDGTPVSVGTAVGIALGRAHEFDDLVTQADAAMYADKRSRSETR